MSDEKESAEAPVIVLEYSITIKGERYALGADLINVSDEESFNKAAEKLTKAMYLVWKEAETHDG
jgi:hypothetical protein